MDLKNYFQEEELKKIEEIIEIFHNKILLSKKVNNPSAILLSIYMLSNQSKKPLVNKDLLKKFFISLSRKAEEFDKAFYEISGKRKGKTKLINIEKKDIGLNFEGLEKIKSLLKNDSKKSN